MMNRTLIRIAIAVAFLAITCTTLPGRPQQAPKVLSIIRNDSTSQVTFEYRSGNEWKKVTIDAQKDTSIAGDRVRIGTDRQDKATITVELPIEGGKKYLLFWNDPPGMWDFKGAV
jgi:hypothetical protein